MVWLLPALTANLSSALLLTLLYLHLYLQDRQPYLKIWTLSWAVYALRFGFTFLQVSTPSPGLLLLTELASLTSAFLLLQGSYLFIGKPFPRPWLFGTAAVTAWLLLAVSFDFSFQLTTLPVFFLIGITHLWTGVIFWRAPAFLGRGRLVLACAFLLWGLHKFNYPLLRPLEWFTPWGYIFASLLGLTVALGMMLVYFERYRQELQLSEEHTKQLQNQYVLILEAVGEGIFGLDRQGRITFTNPAAARLLGWPLEELVGKSLHQYCHHTREDGTPISSSDWASWAALQDGSVKTGREFFWRRDGTGFPVDYSWVPILAENSNSAVVVTFQDITAREKAVAEKKKLHNQLLQSQRVEAIGQLAGGVAHDFNNLLMAINGYGQLMMQQLAPDNPLRQDLREILKAAERAAALTRQLLAFSRRQPLQPRVVDLNGCLVNMGKMLRRLIGEDIRLQCQFAPDLLRISADPGQLEQVVMNMAVNARDAMPAGGELTIKTSNVTIAEEDCLAGSQIRPGRFICLSIEDTGTGMSPEVAARIFEPFYSTKGRRGTGLGLSVAYGIVKQHEGWISLYSEPDAGSTFKIYLPALSDGAADGRQSQPVPPPPGDLQGRGERILVVEDDTKVQQLVSRVLGANGYLLSTAGSAAEGLELFSRETGKFDLLFTDVVLPDRSGLQLIDELLDRQPGLKVLVTSGYTDHRSQWPLIRERGYRFLEKPYGLTALLKTVREVLDG